MSSAASGRHPVNPDANTDADTGYLDRVQAVSMR